MARYEAHLARSSGLCMISAGMRDLQRRELLEDAGYRVIRVTSADLFGDPEAFLARLRALLTSRRA
jgi:very-short-patch-repair endonuclease